MSRINQAFDHGKAFIGFITGGDPNLETTKELLPALQEAGVDLIEIGVPFSDPIAEGIVIQNANERALKAGCTTDKLLDIIKEAREFVTVPMVLLTYMNPVYTYGMERFMKCCKESGIDGIIIPDLPYEEKKEVLPICEKYGVDLISMIAPTSKERVQIIASEAKGFIYCVSSLGVTGVRRDIKTNIEGMLKRVREVTNTPCAIGFGISTKEQVAEMTKIADGVIVGSAIVQLVEQHGENCIEPVKSFVKELKEACL